MADHVDGFDDDEIVIIRTTVIKLVMIRISVKAVAVSELERHSNGTDHDQEHDGHEDDDDDGVDGDDDDDGVDGDDDDDGGDGVGVVAHVGRLPECLWQPHIISTPLVNNHHHHHHHHHRHHHQY